MAQIFGIYAHTWIRINIEISLRYRSENHIIVGVYSSGKFNYSSSLSKRVFSCNISNRIGHDGPSEIRCVAKLPYFSAQMVSSVVITIA